MKITAITRYKHGELYSMLQRIGWTQSELGRQSGISASAVGDIINLVKRPTPEQADAIQKACGTAGEYLDVLSEWPETFIGIKRGYKREQTADVQMDRLIDHPEVLEIAAPEPECGDSMLYSNLDSIIAELPVRHQLVLRERLWNGKSYKETGKHKHIGVSAERVRQIELQAIRMLRHPSRLTRLLDF